MKHAIIKFSELGNRWDAGFHLIRKEYEDRAKAVQAAMSKEEILDLLSSEDAFPNETLMELSPLTRGQQTPNRTLLLKAAEEYPFLAMAIMLDKSEALIMERQAELDRKKASIETVMAKMSEVRTRLNEVVSKITDQVEQGGDEPAPYLLPTAADLDLDAIPDHLLELLSKQSFVAGAVYLMDDRIIVPVHTDGRAYVADCWRIYEDDRKSGETLAETLDRFVEDGNVPVPVLASDILQDGTLIGYITLPDHEQNYGLGWR